MDIRALHPEAWAALQARRTRLPHALLFAGQKGLGKFELAHDFARSLLCENSHSGDPCNQCAACHWMSEGNHPDFRLLQPAALEVAADDDKAAGSEGKKASQSILIEQFREIESFLTVGTHRNGLRVILIYPAEAMNANTANALLKTLEEPLDSTVFLLVTSALMRLMPTIRSRCQLFPIAIPDHQRAKAWLEASGEKESERWLALAGGAPCLARDMAIEMAGAKDIAASKSKTAENHWLDMLLKALAGGRQIDVLPTAALLDKQLRESQGKLTLIAFIDALQKWYVDLSLGKNALPPRYFIAQSGTSHKLAAMIDGLHLSRAWQQMTKRRREAAQPLNARLFLESLLMDYQTLFTSRGPHG